MRSTYNDRVAAEVRAELGRQQMSQLMLAALLGVSQSYVSRRLHGEAPFSTTDLERIADALRVPIETFLARAS